MKNVFYKHHGKKIFSTLSRKLIMNKTTPNFEIVQTISAQLSWSHNTALLEK